MLNFVLPLVFCLTLSSVGALSYSTIVHEKRGSNEILNRSQVDRDAIVPLRIGLKQQSLEIVDDLLLKSSHHSSPRYAKYWTKSEVQDLFAPSGETVSIVRQWLLDSAISPDDIRLTSNGAWLALDLPLRKAEQLLNTSYYELHNAKDGTMKVACDQYYLPLSVSEVVDYVVPGVNPSPRLRRSNMPVNQLRRRSRPFDQQKDDLWKPWHEPGSPQGNDGHNIPPDLSNCSHQVTPPCIRALYNIPQAYLNDSVNSLGIFEAQIYFTQPDLDAYYSQYSPNIPEGTSPGVVAIDNPPMVPPVPKTANSSFTESTIDIDMALSLIYPQRITYYQVSPNFGNQTIRGGDGFIQASVNFLDALDGAYCTTNDTDAGSECGTVAPARVISISYDTPEINRTAAWHKRQCNEFAKLALQGHTIIAASGDYGVGSVPPEPSSNGCIDKDTLMLGENGTIFSPGYPQNCPYVLSVGGTKINANATVYDQENVMSIPGLAQTYGYNHSFYSSSGGFSNVFDRPVWQQKAVETYFSQHDPGYCSYNITGNGSTGTLGADGGIFNRAGRAFPDVSANGANFVSIVKGKQTLSYGTSLAAPLWGAIFTLINEERTAVGKGPVGFVHPVLYAHPEVFNDIVNGSNPGCGTAGFSAVPGWDPVTGLGTPNYEKLLKVFMDLP